MSISLAQQFNIDIENWDIQNSEYTERRLSDLEGFFADEKAYKHTLEKDNPVVYCVNSMRPANNQGDLHFGLGTLMPGKIGNEYYLTKGHLHTWREAAEIYIGVEGNGLMVLEEEETGKTLSFELTDNSVVYVPGYVAHRTVNCGSKPLKYMGIYPAKAGHDYGVIAQRNFLSVIAEVDGEPVMMNRENFLKKYT